MKETEKLNITKSLKLFEEAKALIPAVSWAQESPAILSWGSIRSSLNMARVAD